MEKNILSKKYIIGVFFVFAFGYFLSTLLRAITATLSPVLTNQFSLTASNLGLLAGGYFFGFAAMQIPLGFMLDRFGPKKIVTTFLLVAIVGIIVFMTAQNFSSLLIARILIGIGVSACLMGPLTGYRMWLDDQYQQRANSWMLMIGSLGMLTSTLPVQLLLPLYGWRGIFAGLALLTVLCIILILIVSPQWSKAETINNNIKSTNSLLEVWNNKYFHSFIPLGLFNYGGLFAIQTLWAGPWLINVSGYTPLQSATGLFWINFVMLFAYLFWGYINPKLLKLGYTANKLIIYLAPISFLVLIKIIIFAEATTYVDWIVFVLSSIVITLAQPAVGLAFPTRLAGKALTSFNFILFVGIFIVQWMIGLIIDFVTGKGYSIIAAYQVAFSIFLGVCVISYIYFLKSNFKKINEI
jgi:MFS family permease